MNNTNNNMIMDMINKIPISLYFAETPDRQHALVYVQWLYSNIPQSKLVNQDKLFREVIARELRVISMKIIEIEILIMIALDTITINDFTLDSDSLVKKVMSQNLDKYDLDVMYRVMAQIMTKLPRDLREQVTGVHKLKVFQKIAKFINMEPKLLEKFLAIDTSLNTPISMDLDSGDYNILNKKYLEELKKYQESQPYLNSDSLEHINTLQSKIKETPKTNNVLKAQYIDNKPIIMKGVNDNQLYYYDESSGTLSEMPLNSNQKAITIEDLKTILLSNKVNKDDIKKLLNSLNPTPTTTFETTVKEESIIKNYGIVNSIQSLFLNKNETTTTIPDMTLPPTTIKSTEKFTNMNSNSTKITEAELLKNMKKNNENIENVAIGFVTIIIISFILVIFNTIKNKN